MISRPPETGAKLHHQIPQAYILRFSFDDRRVHVFDRITGRFRCDGVRSVAAESEFYTLTTIEGEKERWAEGRLAQIDEGVRIFDKLERREGLTREERWHIAFFAGFAESRSAGFRQEQRERDARAEFPEDEALTRRFEDAFCAMSGVWVGFDAIEDMARQEMAHIDRGLDDLTAMASAGMQLAGDWFSTEWLVGFAPAGSAFVTSDRPLALLRPEGGFADDPFDENVIKVLPLSPRAALFIGGQPDEPSVGSADIPAEVVRLVNASLARRATRNVIAADRALLRATAVDAKITTC